jgi:cytochrome c553
MAKRSWYSKQAEVEAERKAAMVARLAGMSERELVAELHEIENDTRAMHADRGAHQSNWERLAVRNDLTRAELAARRVFVVATVAA